MCYCCFTNLFFFAELTRDSRKDVSLESNGQTVLTVFVEQTYFFITRGTFPNRSLLQFFEILVSDCIKCRFIYAKEISVELQTHRERKEEKLYKSPRLVTAVTTSYVCASWLGSMYRLGWLLSDMYHASTEPLEFLLRLKKIKTRKIRIVFRFLNEDSFNPTASCHYF